MANSTKAETNKRGRSAGKKGPLMGFRASPAVRASVAKWAEYQPDSPSLSEAVRRLVEIGLSGPAASPKKPRVLSTARQGAERAAELASGVIGDQMPDISEDEKATRRQRLLKGPSEFRNARRDR
jgi:hypothetical protein